MNHLFGTIGHLQQLAETAISNDDLVHDATKISFKTDSCIYHGAHVTYSQEGGIVIHLLRVDV